ncbi:MAG: hypothetical protein FJW95_16715 [Actinobacteria bacterium]|nr:hypothetical protein [Actinomycetota bacterium]
MPDAAAPTAALARLAPIARRQHGLVTRDQALAACTRRQLEHLVHRGIVVRVRPEVYRVAGAPDGWEPALMAAVLAAGPGAVASFGAAAHLWMLAGFWAMPPIELTTPTRRRVRLANVTVHDSAILEGIHVGRRRSIPVTSVARTLCDLTACCPPNQVARALDDALRRRLVSLTRVRAAYDDLATRGRRRSTVMRALLEERGPSFHPGGSDPEVRMVRVLLRAGLPRPVQQHRVRIGGRTFRLDAAYPRHRVALEYEGFDFHTSRTAFDDRYERDRLLKTADWIVVYVTSRTIDDQLVRDTLWALSSRDPGSFPSM